MATYTNPLRLKLLTDGEEPGVWGQSTNTNLSTVLEAAITGVKTLITGDVNYTLTALNALADDARNAVLIFTGARTAVRTVTAPNVNKIYTIVNNTTGGFGITITSGSGATVTIANGASAQVYCDGSTGFYLALSQTAVAAGTGVSVATVGITATVTNTGVLSNVAGTGISVSGATGNVTINNTGVTSNVAGSGINVSGATGAVTISVPSTSNGYGTRTISTSAPSGGASGDVWYKV